jgi:hypothetical protein
MATPFYALQVYRMTATGWQVHTDKWRSTDRVPSAVQRLYASEGWTVIVYQELTAGADLVYPLTEHVQGVA